MPEVHSGVAQGPALQVLRTNWGLSFPRGALHSRYMPQHADTHNSKKVLQSSKGCLHATFEALKGGALDENFGAPPQDGSGRSTAKPLSISGRDAVRVREAQNSPCCFALRPMLSQGVGGQGV